MNKIKIGISSCLLGEEVRYDGTHKLDHYLRETLGQFVEWAPVCPEVEYGLPVPRESMRLFGDPDNPRLVTFKTRIDHTQGIKRWAAGRVAELEKSDLCGFIFKSRSPSSGMQGVKVYTESGSMSTRGVGIFARIFMEKFPYIPVEDDGRLHDPGLRENFIERVFAFKRWKELVSKGKSRRNLIEYHTEHKLQIMAHSPKHLIELGRTVANAKEKSAGRLYDSYFSLFMDAMRLKATVRKNTNTLLHIMGYFKKNLSGEEKEELVEIINNYRKELIPLIVPVTLLNHYVMKYKEPYLMKQRYLNPHPIELMLRNHV